MSKEAIIFGRVIRSFREAKNLSQEELSFESDVNRTYISHIERGKHQPSITTIFRLADGLQVRASELILAVEKELE